MSICHHCHQPVDSRAIACPHCRTPFKAFGHPGIPLYQTTGEEYLCNSCIYHLDDTCNFPQRPYAKDCTLYHNQSEPLVPPVNSENHSGWPQTFPIWFQRNIVWWLLLGLIIISFLLSL